MLSAINCTSQNTIAILYGAAKWTTRSTCPVLKLRRRNYTPICSNIQIVEVTIKLTLISAYSENTSLIRTGITKNKLKSVKIGISWFTQLWVMLKYEFKEYQNFFSKYLQKQSNYSYYPWNTFSIQHYIYPRAILDLHLFYFKSI